MSAIGAALIGAAGRLIGGQMSQPKVDYTPMKRSIQWKVQDAKEAGIHPLYALGTPTVGPTVTVDPTGEAIAGATGDIAAAAMEQKRMKEDRAYREQQEQIAKEQRRQQAVINAARVRSEMAKARRDEAEAALAASQAQRVRQGLRGDGAPRPAPDVTDPSTVYQRTTTGKGIRKLRVTPNLTLDLPPNIDVGMDDINEALAALLSVPQLGYILGYTFQGSDKNKDLVKSWTRYKRKKHYRSVARKARKAGKEYRYRLKEREFRRKARDTIFTR